MSTPLDVALTTADALRNDGTLFAAEQAYRKILDRDPENGGAWHGLGLIMETKGDLELAGQCQECALSLLPEEQAYLAQCALARLALAAHQPDEAKKWILMSREGLLKAGKYLEAAAIMRTLYQLNPNDDNIKNNLVFFLDQFAFHHGDTHPRLAIECGEEANSLTPAHVLLNKLVVLYSNQGMEEERLSALTRIVELFDASAPPPGPPRGLQDLSIANVTAQQIADALLSDGVVLLRGLLDEAAQAHFLSLAEQRWITEAGAIADPLPPVVIDAMTLVFKHPPEPCITASNVRTASLSDDQTYLYYHQDVTPLCRFGINLWAALDPIDGTRPGLEVLVRRQHKVFPVVPGHMRNIPPYRIPDEAVRGVFPESDFVAPHMATGDGMMFLFSTVHRSHITPEMVNDRRNAELRFRLPFF